MRTNEEILNDIEKCWKTEDDERTIEDVYLPRILEVLLDIRENTNNKVWIKE